MRPTRWHATLRIIHISVEGELLTKVVNALPDRSPRGDRWRHLGAPLPMALAMVTVSLVGSPRGRALLANGAARLLQATTRPRLTPAGVDGPAALPPRFV